MSTILSDKIIGYINNNKYLKYALDDLAELDSEDIAFVALGRISTPNRNTKILNNQVEGFMGFIDFDSTINTEIASNTIINVGRVSLRTGYNTQMNTKMHDNIVIVNNTRLKGDNGDDDYNASIVIKDGQEIEVYNNLFIDYSTNPKPLWGVFYYNTGGKISNTSLTNNKVIITNGNLRGQMNWSTGSLTEIQKPNIKDNNFVADSYRAKSLNGSTYRYWRQDDGYLNYTNT